uniref:Uncharacterized protein n=1 Tax=Calcidiscus leptoporus TaxID=127549 RepID=A0A6U5LZA2_9EUKA|mmetsp:Transcript_51994/g.119619  ORF Transcript_51994/g.119619 Transcript_51994/m.119619 type:complete len:307 (+) Transcript_51994:68-988(+)
MVGEEECTLFAGASGKLVFVTLTLVAFLSYIVIFACRQGRTDTRSWKVFLLDLCKMGAGQACAYAVNVLNAHRNAKGSHSDASEHLDAVSWYLPTFLNDEVIAVPLGISLWHVFLATVRRLGHTRPELVWVEALRQSGRYYADEKQEQAPDSQSSRQSTADEIALVPETAVACGLVGEAAIRSCGAMEALIGRVCRSSCESNEQVRYDWWLVQLSFWVCCVAISRLLGGLFVPLVKLLAADSSPYLLMARWIYELPWTCSLKRWTFAGLFRIVIDVVQLALVDWFNKFRRRVTTLTTPMLPASSGS